MPTVLLDLTTSRRRSAADTIRRAALYFIATPPQRVCSICFTALAADAARWLPCLRASCAAPIG